MASDRPRSAGKVRDTARYRGRQAREQYGRRGAARTRQPGGDRYYPFAAPPERLCCPFLTFTLEVSPERGPLLLRLTGAEGVKDFIRAELHLPTVAR